MDDTKPKLPREMYRASVWGSAAFIGYTLALVAISLTLLNWIWFIGGWAVWLKVAASIPVYLVAGQGLHLMGWVGHEGFHFNLAGNKYVSAIIAIVVTAPLAFFSTVGENTIHWDHHRFTNRAGDEQVVMFPRHRTLLRRILFARAELEHVYLRNMLLLAFGRLQVSAAFSQPVMERLARLDLFLSGSFIALYVAVLAIDPARGVALIVIPHLSGFLSSSIRPYVEHAGTSADLFHQARTVTSPVATAAYFFNNYHLEHHLYPSVPCWRLPRVHRMLRDAGIYEQVRPHIETTFWGAQRCATSAYDYPTPESSSTAAHSTS